MIYFTFDYQGDKLYRLGSLTDAQMVVEPPTPPRVFNDLIGTKKFTDGEDKPFIKKKYEDTLKAILGKTEELDYRGSRWSSQDARMEYAGSDRHAEGSGIAKARIEMKTRKGG